MAKITIAGEAIIIKSALKLEDIRTIQKYRPEALVLMGGEDGKDPIFAIGVTNGSGNINDVGASFGRESYDEDKLAVITMVADGVTGDPKEWVADRIGSAVMRLNELEAKLPAVLEELAGQKAAVLEAITVA